VSSDAGGWDGTKRECPRAPRQKIRIRRTQAQFERTRHSPYEIVRLLSCCSENSCDETRNGPSRLTAWCACCFFCVALAKERTMHLGPSHCHASHTFMGPPAPSSKLARHASTPSCRSDALIGVTEPQALFAAHLSAFIDTDPGLCLSTSSSDCVCARLRYQQQSAQLVRTRICRPC
jgi:hypothetical protein